MKTKPFASAALRFTAFLLGSGVMSLPAEPQVPPPALEQSTATEETAIANVDPFDQAVEASVVPPMVQTQVEFIELSHKTLSKLLFLADPNATNGTALRKKLQAMVEKDEAEVLDTQVVVSRSGQKATNESIHEFIYPTEYEPPSLPCGGFSFDPSSTVAGENAIPTAFEIRNLGGTLELEATVEEEGKLVALRFVPELVWHPGNTTYLERKNALGHIYKLEMPDIYDIGLNTSVTCAAGEYLMVSVLSPKDAKGDLDMTRKVIVFVKCDVLTVE